jgi:hypothetical protein
MFSLLVEAGKNPIVHRPADLCLENQWRFRRLQSKLAAQGERRYLRLHLDLPCRSNRRGAQRCLD